MDLLRVADEKQPDLSSIESVMCGGAAVPESLMRAFEERHGVMIVQGWGMTETSPIGAVARPPAGLEGEDHWAYRRMTGRIVPLVEVRLMGDDGEVPWDGESTGEVEIRGPWIASDYYEDPSGADKFHDGWLRTGDIASMDSRGFMQITDRAKDLIKSGGEWISSVELENALMAHPDVVEAAVIAKPDERWTERPLACVSSARGRESVGGGPAQAPGAHGREVVAAGRVRLHRGGSQDQRGQVRQEDPAGPIGGRSARDDGRPGGAARGLGAYAGTIPRLSGRGRAAQRAGTRPRFHASDP